jgi:hypothetical protein
MLVLTINGYNVPSGTTLYKLPETLAFNIMLAWPQVKKLATLIIYRERDSVNQLEGMAGDIVPMVTTGEQFLRPIIDANCGFGPGTEAGVKHHFVLALQKSPLQGKLPQLTHGQTMDLDQVVKFYGLTVIDDVELTIKPCKFSFTDVNYPATVVINAYTPLNIPRSELPSMYTVEEVFAPAPASNGFGTGEWAHGTPTRGFGTGEWAHGTPTRGFGTGETVPEFGAGLSPRFGTGEFVPTPEFSMRGFGDTQPPTPSYAAFGSPRGSPMRYLSPFGSP